MESQAVHLQTIRSKISELSDFLANSDVNSAAVSSSDSQNLLQDCVLALETNVHQIVSDHSHVASQHLGNHIFFHDAYTDRLRDELRTMEAETGSLSEEIDSLRKLYIDGTCQLESILESLHHVVEYDELEGLRQENLGEHVDQPKYEEDRTNLKEHHEDYFEGLGQENLGEHVDTSQYAKLKAHHADYFEGFKLKHQIEMNEITLKSLEDLDDNLKRIEAIDNIEEALTGLKVIGFEGNIIRVSLRTYIPDVEGVMCQLNGGDDIKQSEVNHELKIEVTDGTMELKNVEIFPNDVHIREIFEAAKTFRKLFFVLSVSQTRSSLGWFLQKVQDRIVMCTIRQLMVKITNKSRHLFKYLDEDELIVAHMIGGIDAFIKPSQGWPLSTSPLKLVSFRSSDQNAKEISLSFLSKVEELANSLDLDIRKSITKFVDGIEEILLENIRP